MKQKCLFVSSAPFDGGAEKSLFTYLDGASASGHIVVVHTNTRLSPQIQAANQIYRLPFAWLVKTSNPLLLLPFITNWIYCSIRILVIAKKHGVSTIFANTFKTYLFTLWAKVLIRLQLMVCLRDNLSAPWQRKILCLSDQIITISGYIQDQLDNKEAAQIIHPCIKQKDVTAPAAWDPFTKKQPGQLIVATIAQLAPWKGQLSFLKLAETFKSNDAIQFMIIGDDQSESNKSYRDQVIKKADQLRNVQFLGHVDRVDLLMRKMDILVHLAADEPFGRVVVEAMLARKAVIALKSGGIPEILEQGKSGLLIDQELALFQSRKAIIDLHQSPAKRLIMGREAYKRAQKFADMDDHIRQVNQLLKAVHAR